MFRAGTRDVLWTLKKTGVYRVDLPRFCEDAQHEWSNQQQGDRVAQMPKE
jgi:hypothetical protein